MSTEGMHEGTQAANGPPPGAFPLSSLRIVRREEWPLLALFGLCIGLCLGYGHGFDGGVVLGQYFDWFAPRVLYIFLITRFMFLLADRWQPPQGLALRVKQFVFGKGVSRGQLLATDLEVCRGLLILFAMLTVYTNIKLRIPLINPTVGDPTFQKMDDFLFGTEIFPWLERSFAGSFELAIFFERLYFHGYFYFVLLVLLLYLRHDRLAIRWCFLSVAYLYILGILITVAYPSFGPCFVVRENYEWVRQMMPQVGDWQTRLWRFHLYVNRAGAGDMPVQGRIFMGIAAFPSLHVAHMTLLSWIAVRCYPVYVPVVVLMTGLTSIATMGFGWHYAVDAIGGIALAAAVCAGVWRALRYEHVQVDG